MGKALSLRSEEVERECLAKNFARKRRRSLSRSFSGGGGSRSGSDAEDDAAVPSYSHARRKSADVARGSVASAWRSRSIDLSHDSRSRSPSLSPSPSGRSSRRNSRTNSASSRSHSRRLSTVSESSESLAFALDEREQRFVDRNFEDEREANHRRLQELEREIAEVAEIFSSLSQCVAESKAHIDTIESSVADARNEADAGLLEVSQAASSSAPYRGRIAAATLAGVAIGAIAGGPVGLGLALGIKGALGIAAASGVVTGALSNRIGTAIVNRQRENAQQVVTEGEERKSLLDADGRPRRNSHSHSSDQSPSSRLPPRQRSTSDPSTPSRSRSPTPSRSRSPTPSRSRNPTPSSSREPKTSSGSNLRSSILSMFRSPSNRSDSLNSSTPERETQLPSEINLTSTSASTVGDSTIGEQRISEDNSRSHHRRADLSQSMPSVTSSRASDKNPFSRPSHAGDRRRSSSNANPFSSPPQAGDPPRPPGANTNPFAAALASSRTFPPTGGDDGVPAGIPNFDSRGGVPSHGSVFLPFADRHDSSPSHSGRSRDVFSTHGAGSLLYGDDGDPV